MKKLIFLICLITVSLSALAQDDLYYTSSDKAGSVPKKANTITVTTINERDSLFNAACINLAESGYGILTADKSTGIISTTEKPVKAGTIKLTVIVKNSVLSIRGNYNYNVTMDLGTVESGPSLYPVEYGGMKNSPMRKAWDEMNKFALLFKGDIQYITK